MCYSVTQWSGQTHTSLAGPIPVFVHTPNLHICQPAQSAKTQGDPSVAGNSSGSSAQHQTPKAWSSNGRSLFILTLMSALYLQTCSSNPGVSPSVDAALSAHCLHALMPHQLQGRCACGSIVHLMHCTPQPVFTGYNFSESQPATLSPSDTNSPSPPVPNLSVLGLPYARHVGPQGAGVGVLNVCRITLGLHVRQREQPAKTDVTSAACHLHCV